MLARNSDYIEFDLEETYPLGERISVRWSDAAILAYVAVH